MSSIDSIQAGESRQVEADVAETKARADAAAARTEETARAEQKVKEEEDQKVVKAEQLEREGKRELAVA